MRIDELATELRELRIENALHHPAVRKVDEAINRSFSAWARERRKRRARMAARGNEMEAA